MLSTISKKNPCNTGSNKDINSAISIINPFSHLGAQHDNSISCWKLDDLSFICGKSNESCWEMPIIHSLTVMLIRADNHRCHPMWWLESLWRHVHYQNSACLLLNLYNMVAHGRVVTSSSQITEVKQRRARLVLGCVTGALVMLPAMCRCVGQAFHIMPPLSTQQWWVPGGTKNGELRMTLAAENALSYPQRRWDRIREREREREFQYQGCKLWSLLNSRAYQTINIGLHIYIYLHLTVHVT